MEANSISPELQEEIQGKVTSYRTGLSGLRYAGELAMAYADGIAEYASKLHLLQQKYDKLKAENQELNAALMNDAVALEYGFEATSYSDLARQYAALKEKAEKMEKVLLGIKAYAAKDELLQLYIEPLFSIPNSKTDKNEA